MITLDLTKTTKEIIFNLGWKVATSGVVIR